MRTSGDYVPSNAVQFGVFMRNLLDYVNLHKTAWNIPQPRLTALLGLFDDFDNALQATAGPHTPAQTLARQEAQAAAAAELHASGRHI